MLARGKGAPGGGGLAAVPPGRDGEGLQPLRTAGDALRDSVEHVFLSKKKPPSHTREREGAPLTVLHAGRNRHKQAPRQTQLWVPAIFPGGPWVPATPPPLVAAHLVPPPGRCRPRTP